MDDRHEHHHILELWQEAVGIQLGESQAADFQSRAEVAMLAHMPARQRQ